jgi:hypothetical protein
MSKLLIVAAALAALCTPTVAAELPDCNTTEVRNTLAAVLNKTLTRLSTELDADTADKRWCAITVNVKYKYWGGLFWETKWRLQQVVYTVEWMNESKGTFWVQTK